MKKVLLSLAAVGTAMSANAQLLNYGFETSDILPGETKIVSENWTSLNEEGIDAFASCEFKFNAAGYNSENALWASTNVTSGTWQRVIAFTNVGIQENKSYRISMMVKGDSKLDVALLKGCFNHDLALQTKGGTQTKTFTLESNEFQRISYVVWSPTREQMTALKSDFATDSIWAKDFLRLSFCGIGEATVDDIKIEESSVENITFNGSAICVKFGYETNIAELSAVTVDTLATNSVKVLVDGEEVAAESVELKQGNLYIFLNEEEISLNEDSKVSVSFTNTGKLKYASQVAPNCYDEPNCAVLDFADEAGYYDGDLNVESMAYEPAVLVTSTPANTAFEIDNDINTFTFTFDKNVLDVYVDEETKETFNVTAVLSGAAIKDEPLKLISRKEPGKTLSFERANNTTLPNGNYTIVVDNVYNEKGTGNDNPFEVTFQTGKVVLSETKYEFLDEIKLDTMQHNYIPEGWAVMSDGALRLPGTLYGSGGGAGKVGSKGRGIYTRANGGEGSATTPTFELPEGDIEVRSLLDYWSNSSSVKISIMKVGDTDTTEVFSEDVTTTIKAEENLNNASFSFEKFSSKFTATAGKYYIKYTLNTSGFNGMFVGGVEFYKYTVTEGISPDPTYVINEKFSDVAANYIPAYGSGWRIHRKTVIRTPGANGTWGGNCVTGGGGPRIFDLSFKNMAGKGIYLSTEANVTFGEFLNYTDTAGIHDEKVLEAIEGQTYKITYYISQWKNESLRDVTFSIYKQTDGIDSTATAVYSRTDNATTEIDPAGNSGNSNVEAIKIAFDWDAPADGNYILSYKCNGEAFVGNISIIIPGSIVAQCKLNLKDALAEANTELEVAENEIYAGTTLKALQEAIVSAANNDFHLESEYDAAIAKLNALVKAMGKRRANVDDYANSLADLGDKISAAASKYTNIQAYIEASTVYEQYKEVTSLSLEDEDLANAVAAINKAKSILSNYTDKAVDLLTKQVKSLAEIINKFDADQASNETVLLASKAIVDDQVLAAALKQYATAAIYKSIANGYNFTVSTINSDTTYLFDTIQLEGEEIKIDTIGIEKIVNDTIVDIDSIDVTGYIQNNEFYCTTGAEANVNSYPGWTINVESGTLTNSWAAGWDAYAGNESAPIQNAKLKMHSGTNKVTASQKITSMPAGTFTLVTEIFDESGINMNGNGQVTDIVFVRTNEAGDTTWVLSSYISYTVGENEIKTLADLSTTGTWRAPATHKQTGMVIPADAESNYASTTLTGCIDNQSFAYFDNVRIYMTAKDASFDYAAAAKAVAEQIVGLQEVEERTDAPTSVSFFNLAGQQVAAPQGVSIKIERYADGYTVVKKVIVK